MKASATPMAPPRLKLWATRPTATMAIEPATRRPPARPKEVGSSSGISAAPISPTMRAKTSSPFPRTKPKLEWRNNHTPVALYAGDIVSRPRGEKTRYRREGDPLPPVFLPAYRVPWISIADIEAEDDAIADYSTNGKARISSKVYTSIPNGYI